MRHLRKRFALFLLLCLTIRTGFVFLAYYLPPSTVQYFAIPALLLAASWMYIMFIRARDTGVEVNGERIWWQSLRPLHVAYYAVFSALALLKSEYAWVPLAFDVSLGFSAFLWHHGQAGSFSKLSSGK